MAFNFTKKLFFNKESHLGVDIGTTSIKVAEVFSDKEKPELLNYALFETYSHQERINTALQTSSLKLYDREVAEYLKLIIKKSNFQSRRAIAALPAFAAFTTLINVPLMSQEELGEALKFRAKQHIPLPASSVTIDWIKIGEKTDESGQRSQQIFLVAIPNDYIKQYQNIFNLAGLELEAMEVDGFSLARVLTMGSTKPILIADIGSRSTTFLVGQGGLLKYISQSDFAGSSLTQSLASGLGVKTQRAEELKKQKGLAGLNYEAEQELSTLLLPVLDVIINEAKRVKSNYQTSYQQELTDIILAGGGANLLGIEDYFKRELAMSVSKAKPLSHFSYPPKLEPLVDEIGPLFAVTLGLGIKSLI